jgi:hypothetical protein
MRLAVILPVTISETPDCWAVVFKKQAIKIQCIQRFQTSFSIHFSNSMTTRVMELLALAQRLCTTLVYAFLRTKGVTATLVDSFGFPKKTARIDTDVLAKTMLNAQVRALKINPIGAILIRVNVVQIANEPFGFNLLLLEVCAQNEMITERTRKRAASIITLLFHNLVQLACPG